MGICKPDAGTRKDLEDIHFDVFDDFGSQENVEYELFTDAAHAQKMKDGPSNPAHPIGKAC